MSTDTMPEWENDLRKALVTPGPEGCFWARPSDWTIEQAVEAMRPHVEDRVTWDSREMDW